MKWLSLTPMLFLIGCGHAGTTAPARDAAVKNMLYVVALINGKEVRLSNGDKLIYMKIVKGDGKEKWILPDYITKGDLARKPVTNEELRFLWKTGDPNVFKIDYRALQALVGADVELDFRRGD